MRYVNYTLYILWVTVALLYAQPADAIRRNPNTAAAIHLAQQKNIGLQSITENAARAHVGFLAHDLMEGCLCQGEEELSQRQPSPYVV